MRVVAVLDLQDGQVVRGVGGRRQDYRPIVSRLTSGASPVDVARGLRDHLGLQELYLADLDAISGARPALETISALQHEGFQLWVDVGLRKAADAHCLIQAGVATVVAGLETLSGPDELAALAAELGNRLVFSLDLRNGKPLGDRWRWESDAWSIARQALAQGVRRLLVLDLARVGLGAGIGTEELCARLAAVHPGLDLSAGGGVRGRDELERLQTAGVSVALVASALHDGRLTRADLQLLAAC
jgi:phosphoribosylformimino-5-aminoimidazole carboxamide ribotide isomerase